MTSSATSNPGRVVAWLAIVVLVIYLVFIGGGFSGIYVAQLRILSLAFIAAVLTIWLAWAWWHPAWRPRTVIWPAFVVALTAFALGTVLSPTPRLGIDYLAYSILLTALYLLLVRLDADPFFRVRLGALTVGLCFGLCVIYVGAIVVHWINWWSLVGAIKTPPLRPWFEGLRFGNPSAVMTIAVLLLAPSLAHLGLGTPGRRVAAVGLSALVLLVTLTSGSRSGWLALPIGVAVTAIAWLLIPDNRARIGTLMSGRLARLAILVAAGFVLALGIAFAPGILGRVGGGGEALRIGLYVASLRMFEVSPLTGLGPGGWAANRAVYTQPSEIDYYIPHAHSIYFQTLAEFGVLGIGAGIVVVACLVWLIAGAVRSPDSARRRYGWAGLFSVAYFGAHQALDFYPNMPAALFAFALPIALLDATAGRSIGDRLLALPTLSGWIATGLLALLSLGAIGTLAWSEARALPAADAVDALDHERWASALPLARAAADSDPAMTAYRFNLGLAAANTGDLDLAARSFETSARADDFPEAWLDLAGVRLQMGDRPGARDALTKALRLGFQQPAIDVAAARLYLQLGDQAAASRILTSAVAEAPSLAGDPYWTVDPLFSDIWPAVLERAIASTAPEQAWEIALVSGNPVHAASRADGLAPDAKALALLVIPAWGGDPTAIGALETRALERPLDIPTLTWTARVLSRSGNAAASLRYRDWASTVDGYSGAGAAEMRVVARRDPGDAIAGSNTGWYGTYTYRRPTPIDRLLPDLPRLTYR